MIVSNPVRKELLKEWKGHNRALKKLAKERQQHYRKLVELSKLMKYFGIKMRGKARKEKKGE